MKKVILHISEVLYERLRFEAMQEEKSIPQVIYERILHKKFSDDVEQAFQENLQNEFNKLLEE